MPETNNTLDDICYKKNYLTEVIARVDFPSPIQELREQMPPRVSSEIMQIFPIAEPRSLTRQEFQISPDKLSTP